MEKLQASKPSTRLIFALVSQLSTLCFPILIRPPLPVVSTTNTLVVYIISLPSPPGQDQEPWICSNSIDISCFDLEAEENEVAIIIQFLSIS